MFDITLLAIKALLAAILRVDKNSKFVHPWGDEGHKVRVNKENGVHNKESNG